MTIWIMIIAMAHPNGIVTLPRLSGIPETFPTEKVCLETGTVAVEYMKTQADRYDTPVVVNMHCIPITVTHPLLGQI